MAENKSVSEDATEILRVTSSMKPRLDIPNVHSPDNERNITAEQVINTAVVGSLPRENEDRIE